MQGHCSLVAQKTCSYKKSSLARGSLPLPHSWAVQAYSSRMET